MVASACARAISLRAIAKKEAIKRVIALRLLRAILTELREIKLIFAQGLAIARRASKIHFRWRP